MKNGKFFCAQVVGFRRPGHIYGIASYILQVHNYMYLRMYQG